METVVRQPVALPALATPEAYAIVPCREAPPATNALAIKLVDDYVEANPKVALARARFEAIDAVHDRMVAIGVMPATFGVITGLVAASSGPHWWVIGGCAAVIAAGSYITSLSGRIWKSAREPAKAELEQARLEVRAELQGPDDLKSVAERLAGSRSEAA